jgi:hypothetical protein
MPSYCHGLPLPCGKDQANWIETKSDASPPLSKDSESSEEEKSKSTQANQSLRTSTVNKTSKTGSGRNLQIAAVATSKSPHPGAKDRCLNANHVYEMMVRWFSCRFYFPLFHMIN